MGFCRSLAHICALVVLLVPSQRTLAHEGHDHGSAPNAVGAPALPRGEAASEQFELVAVAEPGEVVIYLDRFATNEPVTDGTVVVETPHGSVEATTGRDGTYRVAAPWVTAPGHYDLIATVTQGGTADVLAFRIDIQPAGQPAPSAGFFGSALARDLSDKIAFGGGSSTLIGWLTAFILGGAAGVLVARRRRVHAKGVVVGGGLAVLLSLLGPGASGASAHDGNDHGSATPRPAARSDVAQLLGDGSAFIPKSTQRILAIRTAVPETSVYRRSVELPGRIIPDPNASGFVQAVVGGRLSPPEGGFPRLGTPVRKGDVLAYVTAPLQAIDVSDMRQRQGELDQQISIMERRIARYENLVPGGALPRTQLEEGRLELQGLRNRRASLDRVRHEPEALIAPVDGIVADGTPVAGQVAQANQVVFNIIDPGRLWVEALSYESLPALQEATARVGDRELTLAFRGAGFADRNQSIPIHFAIEGDVSGLRAGQFVTVFANTSEELRGIAVPRTSVVRNAAGQDTVFEHVSAERFEPRAVRIEPLDGQRVLIAHGLAPGKRIVVQGAELIGQIR